MALEDVSIRLAKKHDLKDQIMSEAKRILAAIDDDEYTRLIPEGGDDFRLPCRR